MSFNYLGYDVLSAAENMQKDIAILKAITTDVFLRLYSWTDTCVTFGYNQKEDTVKSLVGKLNINTHEFVRRPTGGGLVVHERKKLAWSLFVPVDIFAKKSLLGFYYDLSNVYADLLQDCGINCSLIKSARKEFQEKRINDVCLDYPAKYELIDENGNKLIGSAQKKTKSCLIQQNNLFIKEPREFREKLVQSLFKYFTK